jgi:hypothetical protein
MGKAVLPFLNGLGLSCHGYAQLGQHHKDTCVLTVYQFGL